MKKVNVLVVGCGYWGPNLIRNLMALPDCTVKVVCDVDKKRLAHQKSLYPSILTRTRFSNALKVDGLNAAVIATPVRFHYKLAKACLEAGLHTFIEKPMASSVAECEELVAIAEKRGLTLMVGHTFLYSAPVRAIKKIVDSGDIGSIRYMSSRRLNLGLFQTDINVVWDLAPHDISIVTHIMEAEPIGVNCQGAANVTPHIEDVANLTLTFPNGAFATIHNSWLDPKKVRDMAIVGTKKMIVYDDLEPQQKIKVHDQHVDAPPYYDTFAEFQCAYHYGGMYAPYIKIEEPLRVECLHFMDCIRTGNESLTSGRKGLDLVRVLEAADESLRNNGAHVSIEPAPPPRKTRRKAGRKKS